MKPRCWVGVLALVALAAGCGGDDGGAGSDGDGPEATVALDVTSALAELRGLLEGTAGAITDAGRLEVVTDLGPVPCQSSQTGAVTDAERATLTAVVPVATDGEAAALRKVAAFWEGEGLQVDTDRQDGPEPEVLGRGEALSVSALGIPGSGQVSLMGATDCLGASAG